ncbi:hypothetical protein [Methanomassiliicoccus luminyensis]|jgi:hypothetical protein|uniref:hypothetical protein n=1 Tax=Methanomassiliicoccus luminyensis TaxID=1080712 RepID=UPI00037E6CC1|nr:hypothetical protein [Methanomassiliicoccus luminyensis]
MVEAKKPKAKAPVIKKSTKSTTSRLGSSKVRSVEKRNMVALNEKVIAHMKLKVGDVVSYAANEDGTVTIRKAAKGKKKKTVTLSLR